MTKEITKSIILQQIQDKFKLREFEASPFLFSEIVSPVYNIEEHLKNFKESYQTVSITGIAAYTFFTVPDDEKWVLSRYDVVFMATSVYTVAGVFTQRTTDGSKYCYLDLAAAQSVSYHVSLPFPISLVPGNKLRISIDGYTSTADLRMYIDYIVEKIR